MNPLLSSLQPYPFERLKQLFSTVTPNPAYAPISLGIGEPRHATPQLVLDALAKGDEVVTAGGLLGKVSKIGDAHIGVELATGVEVQMQRSAVVQVLPKGTLK